MTNLSNEIDPVRRRRMKALAPIALVLILIVAACGSSEDDAATAPTTRTPAPTTTAGTAAGSTTTAIPVTTQPPRTTTVPPFTVDDALAVNDAYFAAYEAGDVAAMLALFAPDIFLDDDSETALDDWEQLYVWKVAEGTVLTTRDCAATASESVREVTVRCQYGHHEYLSRAVDGPDVPHSMRMVVTPAGITWLTNNFGSPDFNVVGAPFSRWMEDQHPEDAPKVGFGTWTTVEEARQNGLLTVQFVDEWVAYLDANGCTYLDGC